MCCDNKEIDAKIDKNKSVEKFYLYKIANNWVNIKNISKTSYTNKLGKEELK